MQNQHKQTDHKSPGAYAPNEKFANWDKNSSQKQSNHPGIRNKNKKKYEFPKDTKNRINPAASNFVSEGNPNTDQKIKKVQEEAQRSDSQLYKQQNESSQPQHLSDEKRTESNQQFHPDQSADAQTQENELQSQSSFADQQLALDIQAAIEKEESIVADDKSDIQVSVEHGAVTLTGTVFSDQQKRTIGDKAVAFAGTGKVHNQLDVREITELG